jgi:hypothetical protein
MKQDSACELAKIEDIGATRVVDRFSRIRCYRQFRLFLSKGIVGLVVLFGLASFAHSQQQLDSGFTKITEGGQHLTVITDLPVDDDLLAFPAIFDKAMLQWCERFDVDPKTVRDWRPTLYLMQDRNRFKQAGLIPNDIPKFENGWQQKDEMWVVEQHSHYYRRHLVLHEGTHWFMFRKYGFYDTPWLFEGMAELLGTHRWKDGDLKLEIIPQNREEVPYWGRVKIIRDQCAEGLAPSMEDILRFSNTAHQRVDAYAWSWALTMFLKNHPDTSKVFEALMKQEAMSTREVDRWLRARLTGKLPRIRAAWRSFISELDYGYSTTPGMLQLTAETVLLKDEQRMEIRSDRGWQATGFKVEPGQKLLVKASGQFEVAQQPKPWTCTPAGVTLEYYRGQPLGKLLMLVVQPEANETNTELTDAIPVGDGLEYESKTGGEIFFKINEPAGKMSDNLGSFQVTLTP